jgi:hypothetical protein
MDPSMTMKFLVPFVFTPAHAKNKHKLAPNKIRHKVKVTAAAVRRMCQMRTVLHTAAKMRGSLMPSV